VRSVVYRLGISEFTTWPWTFEQDVQRYRAHGIDAIEVTEFKLDPNRVAEQLALIPANSLQVSSVQARIHSLYPTLLEPQPSAPADRLRHIRDSIESIAPHVPPGSPFVVITGAAPNGNIDEVLRTARREFLELAKFAEAHGVRVALEPLNPTLMNVDSSLWSLGDALDLVEHVGHPAFGLCVDAWNIWQSPNLIDTMQRCGERILVVQISDWRTPTGYYDRLVPGEGAAPLLEIVDAVNATGFDGPYVIEIFSSESLPGSLWRTDLDRLLDRCTVGFDTIWNSVVARGNAASAAQAAMGR
jgi:sugar phosphate isomerase/epimerase